MMRVPLRVNNKLLFYSHVKKKKFEKNTGKFGLKIQVSWKNSKIAAGRRHKQYQRNVCQQVY